MTTVDLPRNAFKAAKRLGWQAQWRMPQVVAGMVAAERELQRR